VHICSAEKSFVQCEWVTCQDVKFSILSRQGIIEKFSQAGKIAGQYFLLDGCVKLGSVLAVELLFWVSEAEGQTGGGRGEGEGRNFLFHPA